MKLAINYSTQAAVLLKSGRIKIDYFKCPDWPGLISEASQLCPVAIHFNLTAGNGQLQQTDWSKIETLLYKTATPYVSLHLEPKQKYYPGFSTGALNPSQHEQVVERILKDIELTGQHVGAERVILENVPYRGHLGKVLRPAIEPDTFCYILEQIGAGLLLDISHARITAHFLGMDEKAYLSQLPVDRIKEMHFTGLHDFNGWKRDHLPILPADWPVLDWVLAQIRSGCWAKPWLLAFEYGGVGEKFAWCSDAQAMAQNIPPLAVRIANL